MSVKSTLEFDILPVNGSEVVELNEMKKKAEHSLNSSSSHIAER
jgi:hypothetical protein